MMKYRRLDLWMGLDDEDVVVVDDVFDVLGSVERAFDGGVGAGDGGECGLVCVVVLYYWIRCVIGVVFYGGVYGDGFV